jgi:hypothetical protein
VHALSLEGVYCVHCREESGALVVLLINTTQCAVEVASHCKVKVCVGRGGDGEPLANQTTEAAECNKADKSLLAGGKNNGSSGGFRWTAKWKIFRSTCVLQAQSQKIGLTLVPDGIQAQFGAISFQAKVVARGTSCDAGKNKASPAEGGALRKWLGINNPESAGPSSAPTKKAAGLFGSLHKPLSRAELKQLHDTLNLGPRKPHMTHDGGSDSVDLEMAMAMSVSKSEADFELKKALEMSKLEHEDDLSPCHDHGLEMALLASKADIMMASPGHYREPKLKFQPVAPTIDLTTSSPSPRNSHHGGGSAQALVVIDD